MYLPLLSIAVALLLCVALRTVPRWAGLGRAVAPLGIGVALGLALWREGLDGGGILGRSVGWPQPLTWLGTPVFRMDALSAGLGAWCLLIGTLYLLKMAVSDETPRRIAVSALIVGTLYSLVHTDNLLAFAGQTLALVLLVWAYSAGETGTADNLVTPLYGRQLGALGAGALLLLGAVMLLGRTTGGNYSLVGMSISALTVWPLVLIVAFALLWLGLLPFTGWSAEGHSGARQALIHTLLIGLPVITLVLRLEALLSAQALAGTLPGEWQGFTNALAWLGSITALVSAAGLLFWAGKSRWPALLTAHAMGLMLWGLALDTPQGRYAAVALQLAYGAGRVTLELNENTRNPPRLIAWASLAAAPLGAGFVGVWLLGAALAETGRPTLAIALAGMVVLAASGIVLGAVLAPRTEPGRGRWSEYLVWIGMLTAGALLVGGTLPGLWLPLARSVVSIAGGKPGAGEDWTGLSAGDNQSSPVLLMLGGVAALLLLGWLLTSLVKSKVRSSGTLLPTALVHMSQARDLTDIALNNVTDPFTPLLRNPPVAVWWVSLAWLEAGIMSTGTLLGRLGRRAGRLLGRLEGRFYLPLALIMALLLVLAVTR